MSITVLDIRSPKWVPLSKTQGVGRAALLLEALGGPVSLPVPASGDGMCFLAPSPASL